jgi:hypothetical protein
LTPSLAASQSAVQFEPDQRGDRGWRAFALEQCPQRLNSPGIFESAQSRGRLQANGLLLESGEERFEGSRVFQSAECFDHCHANA